MTTKLQRLLELAKLNETSPELREAQRVSFAYGNAGFENDDLTREDVMRASQKLKEDQANEQDQPAEQPKG